MSDRLTLALDGSTDVCSTALLRAVDGRETDGSQVVAKRAVRSGRGQAKVLLSMVDEMLEEIDAAPSDVGSVVVGTGPGTFTGVRIAVATARGVALALEVPVFGVSSLAALTAGVLETVPAKERSAWGRVVPVIDARRRQVFYAVYEVDDGVGAGGGERWALSDPIGVCDRGQLAERAGDVGDRMVMVVGGDAELADGLPSYATFLRHDVQAEYLVLGEQRLVERLKSDATEGEAGGPGAQAMAGSPETVKPIYVRAPDADTHITKMKDPWAR